MQQPLALIPVHRKEAGILAPVAGRENTFHRVGVNTAEQGTILNNSGFRPPYLRLQRPRYRDGGYYESKCFSYVSPDLELIFMM